MRTSTLFATAAALAAIAVPAASGAGTAPARIVATVGPGMNIAVSTASGASARVLKAGMYRIVVRDRSTDHNFRLAGPGVSKTTSIEGTGNATWTVRLVRGKTYRFWCDPHSDEMRGSFRMK